MKNFRYVFCSLLLLTWAGIASAQTVQSDYDRSFNLTTFKAYAFHPQERRPGDPLASNSINDRRIHDALDSQLKVNGFTPSEQPDFWIGYFVKARQGVEIQDNRFGPLLRRGTVNVENVTEGTLIVIFVDAASKKEVWRGYATGTVNPKDLEKDVNKAVSKLIERFKKDQVQKK